MVPEANTSPKVPQQTIDYIQAAVGIFLWCGHIVNLTLLPALNTISAQQMAPTEETVKALDYLLSYMATYPNTTVSFYAINMILHIHNNAAYMVLPEACPRTSGYFYLFSKQNNTFTKDIPLNGAIHSECSTIHNVMGSAAEAKLGGLYINCQRGEEFRVALQEMGHPQPPTIVITDNSTAERIVNNRVKQHRTRAMVMIFYWIWYHIKQGHYLVMWKLGDDNLADYSTKHSPPAHHKKVHRTYLVEEKSGAVLTCLWVPDPKDPVRVCWDTRVQTPWIHDPMLDDQVK
eukprot:5541697-Ditylum_brightwellii.AAC.1